VSVREKRDILAPFRAALNGIVYTFKTQRHLRFQMYLVLVALLVGLFAKSLLSCLF
jgi:diacylglycerol kinase (ATP)